MEFYVEVLKLAWSITWHEAMLRQLSPRECVYQLSYTKDDNDTSFTREYMDPRTEPDLDAEGANYKN